MQRSDQIHLELPASPAYGRVVRIAAAHLALRRGFSLHEIDDLRLAMDEAAVMLLGPGVGDGRLDVVYSLDGSTITVDARVVADAPTPDTALPDSALPDTALPEAAVERFSALVGELVDSYTVDRAHRRLSLTKTRVG